MALRWQKKRVSLDITDEARQEPTVIEHDGWKVLRVGYAQLEDYQVCRSVMHTLADLLRSSAPDHPDWDQRVHELNDLVLARSA